MASFARHRGIVRSCGASSTRHRGIGKFGRASPMGLGGGYVGGFGLGCLDRIVAGLFWGWLVPAGVLDKLLLIVLNG